MGTGFASISHVSLQPGTTYVKPPAPPEIVHMENPAIDVMTDFEVVHAVTVRPETSIDDALEHMKTSGVRLLLVTSDEDQVIGLVTANDIRGERPIKIVQESRIPRSKVDVKTIMTGQESIIALNMISVRNAKVGHVVETLNQLKRQHILVVEIDEQTKAQRLRGLFSTSQISKQLGRNVAPERGAAQSLAEIQHDIG